MLDPSPHQKNPTLFHRLAATSNQLEVDISPDIKNYQDWYFKSKLKFERLAKKFAVMEVEETL